MGRVLDWEYKSIKKSIEQKLNEDREKTDDTWIKVKDEDFPIEWARLRTMPIHLGLFVVCCFGYGWSARSGSLGRRRDVRLVVEGKKLGTPCFNIIFLVV